MISRRWLKRGLLLSTAALVLWLVVSFLVAYRLTRRPHSRFEEPAPTAEWGEFEPYRIMTRDGEKLGAWLVRGEPDALSILLLHGHGGSRRNGLVQAEMLALRGYSVLMVSLRAHGDSSGDFDDGGFGARHDVIAAVEFLERQRPGRPVVILGRSMGSAAAVFASRELGHRVRGYILECPYRDLKSAVRNRIENALPPILDWVAYQGLLTVAPLLIPDLEQISPLSAIEGVPEDIPILILAGGQDRRARLLETRAIHDCVKSHARLSIYKDAGHVQLLATEPQRYKREIRDFLWNLEEITAPGN
jgi:pimeloyl-ACP methyl ester carboxylesterase